MTKEFNLSEYVYNRPIKPSSSFSERELVIPLKDVQEFIKRLKEEISSNIAGSDKFYNDNPENLLNFIDKLAGDKLI